MVEEENKHNTSASGDNIEISEEGKSKEQHSQDQNLFSKMRCQTLS